MTVDNVKNIPPRIYHNNDPDGVFQLWKDLTGQVYSSEIESIEAFQEIIDPDTAPEVFVDLMLANLGNPFKSVSLTLTQKRKLVRLLIPIYKQKDTERGIVNAIRFLTGIEVDLIDPYGVTEDSWQVGISEIGVNSYIGGSRVYCNMLNWSEDFGNANWTKTSMSVTTGLVTGPEPWYRPADLLVMTTPGATLEQTVTPNVMQDQVFTASIWLRADAAETVDLEIEVSGDATDSTSQTLNVTTSWQRFSMNHQVDPAQANLDLIFRLTSAAGLSGNIYGFGAQLVRNDEMQPYSVTEDDGSDCNHPGAWAYHFLIVVNQILTENEEAIIRLVADFMKSAHKHYTLITPAVPGAPDLVDHWEVGISLIGVNTFVHS